MEKWWWGHGRELLLEGTVLGDGRRVYEHSLRQVRALVAAHDAPRSARARRRGRRARRGGDQRRGRVLRRFAGLSATTRPRAAGLVAPLDDSLRSAGRKWPGRQCSGEIAARARRRASSTAERIIARSSGCSPSTATPSSSTSLPTALRSMKTRCGRKRESSTNMTVFVRRRAASGIPRYRAAKTLPRRRTRTNPVASSRTTRSRTSISISRPNCPTNCSAPSGEAICSPASISPSQTKRRRRATSARSGRRAGCHCFRVVRRLRCRR